MAQFSQTDRLYQAMTPLGEDALLFGTMEVEERLSRPFEFILTLFSERGDLDADLLLGKPVTARIARKDGMPRRYFNGLAADFALVGFDGWLYHYRVTLRPWLWFLTLSADCRTFQNETAPQIVQTVCRQAGFTDLRLALSASYEPREYCVQLRETDFNFVSRLLEQEGIFYYFEHSEDKHVLVLCDDPATLSSAPGYDSVLYQPTPGEFLHVREFLTSWTFEKSFRSGRFATRQFEFKTPTPVLAGTSSIERAHDPAQFETFDFPALAATSTSAAVEQVARVRVEELQTGQMLARGGSGNAVGLATGRVFMLESHSREDLNIRYLISSTRIQMSNGSYFAGQEAGPKFSIAIEAVRADEPYRPARTTAKPLVHGLQSAVVVGPSGAEVYPDEYGRVKVQFYWDRQGELDENSSCWIRVAQTWAGNGWGAVQIPRVGQEVVIAFLDGDPDRPVIVGCLYNGSNKPPYALPANATQSGVRSRSSTGATAGNYNEIRFEDKKGAEQLSLQAEKDYQLVVKKDSSVTIGGNKTVSVAVSLEVTAGAITLTAGHASLTLNRTGLVELSGTMILINGKEAVNITAALGLIKGPILAPP